VALNIQNYTSQDIWTLAAALACTYKEELLDRITPTKEVKKGSKSTFIAE